MAWGPSAERADGIQPRRDVGQRVVPRHRLEAAGTLGAHAPERVREAVAMVGSFHVAIHLGAQESVRERMLGIAGHAHGASAFDRDEHGAGVGAVVRTRAAHDPVVGRRGNGERWREVRHRRRR